MIQSADDNFKFDENSRKFSNPVENTRGKEEIARCEEFFLFPQCFQKACFPGASKGVTVWEWVKTLKKKAYEIIIRKEEKAGNQHLLLYPIMFSTLSNKFSPI